VKAMTRTNKIGFAVTAIFFVSFAVQAQGRGGGSGAMSARVAPMPVRTGRAANLSGAPVSSGARGVRPATVIQISPSGRTFSSTGSFANSINFGDGNGVPGLGFDYPHLAAVGGNFRGNPPGFGRGGHRERNFVTPFLYGGFPYYSDFGDYQQEPQQQEPQQEPQQQQPQVIVIQQPVPAAPVDQSVASAPQTTPNGTQPAPAPAPVPEVGELVLVRRDGRVLFASIFSVTGNQVQYVTPEGIRRVLPLSDLDTVATQEMNEARGTTLQFHN
jgi:hypothetical protein